MANIRILELAKELNTDVIELQRIAIRCGLAVSGPTSMLDDEDKQKIIEALKSKGKQESSRRTLGRTLTLNRPMIAGQSRMGGKDDRGRTVTVEVRRRRIKVSESVEPAEKKQATAPSATLIRKPAVAKRDVTATPEPDITQKTPVVRTPPAPEARGKEIKKQASGGRETSRGPRTTFRKGLTPAQIASSKAPRSTIKQLENQIKTERAARRNAQRSKPSTSGARAVPRRTPSVAVAPMPTTPPPGAHRRRGGQIRPQRKLSPAERAARRHYEELKRAAPLTEEEEERLARLGSKPRGKKHREGEKEAPKVVRSVEIPEVISVGELASRMAVKGAEVVKKLFEMGMPCTVNESIDAETALLLVEEFGHRPKLLNEGAVEDALLIEKEDEDEGDLEPRPPIVVIMGHVDHGKTALLDALRKSSIAKGEAGGITQHIGAYMVKLNDGNRVVFLDTPGHEAFTSLRARGAKITDVVVLVVAADDGVKPQTLEALNHAKAANVPIIVAINKIDKPEADIEKVKRQMAEHGLIPEEWGGDAIFVPVSALTGEGLDELLEMLSLQTEILELKANPKRRGRGVIVESRLDRGRGPVATVLVENGTFKQGDIVVTGTVMGRIRALVDENGVQHKTAGPSIPAEILGLEELPEAGQEIVVVENERQAREIIAFRKEKIRQLGVTEQAKKKLSLDELFSNIQEKGIKELPVVIKADVGGSVEAMAEALSKVGTEDVKVNIIHKGIGGITETDIMLASASNAIIIGFNVRPEAKAKRLAETEGVDVRFYKVIYDAIDDIKQALSGLLAPEEVEKVIGSAEVRDVFSVPKVGKVAGCYVTDGYVTRHASVRVLRDGVLIYDGKLASLKRFKEDVKEVKSGYECGIGIDKFNDIKVGDTFEFYLIEEVAASL
jgi:translation initiation factor IF-2